jgi:hypothetical protein
VGSVRTAAALALLSLAAAFAQSPHDVILWAWERPEDLRFLDPEKADVAFVAASFFLRENRVIIKPRTESLLVPPKIAWMAVFRIQTDSLKQAALESGQIDTITAEIKRFVGLNKIPAVQIDFEAKLSERNFYSQLLDKLRQTLGTAVYISITAPTSWCSADSWLKETPTDEVVPVIFRPGSALPPGGFGFSKCQGSLGLSIAGELRKLPSTKRVYLYDPVPWKEQDYRNALAKLK